MSKAERFDMGQAITDFSLTTTVDLRMLFLSMPLFQRGVKSQTGHIRADYPFQNPLMNQHFITATLVDGEPVIAIRAAL